MQADHEDRYTPEGGASSRAKLPIVLAGAAVLVGIAWFLLSTPGEQESPPPATPLEAGPVAAPEPPPPSPPTEPDIPEPEVAEPEPAPEPEPPEPALTLEESDAPVQALLAPQVVDSPLAPALDNSDLIQRAASLIDASSQGRAFPEVLKLPPPEEKFAVVERDGAYYADPDSYRRYDAYAQAIAGLEPEQLSSAFHTFRPLLEEAYAALGYREEDMDNALVRALDQVIAAPVLQHPAQLERDITTWHYTDETLEELPSLAKLLLRMGPENQALVQAQARALRDALLSPDSP